MKIEKRGSSYRVRKQINKINYQVTFDHKPTQKEIDMAFIEVCPTSSKNALKNDFKTYCIKYMSVKDNVLSASTKRGYNNYINTLPDWFMNIPLKELTRSDVQKLVNDYSADHAPKSVKNMHGFIAGIISMYRPDLVLNTQLPQKKEYQGYVPTPEEVKKVLDAAEGTKYWLVFKLGIYSLRRSEVCALTPDDLEGQVLHITKAKVKSTDKTWIIQDVNKTEGSSRDVVISQEMADKIHEQGFIFNGCPTRITHMIHEYQDRAGVPRFRFHDLRAYFATEMSKLMPEQDWLAMGGWESDYVAKKIYRKSRIAQNKEIQLEASKKLESL